MPDPGMPTAANGGTVNEPAGAAPDARAVDDLYRRVYGELCRIAARVRAADPFTGVSTRTLVHETWLKCAGCEPDAVDERHLKHIVVRAMRQVLVDDARRRRRAKRDGVALPLDAPSGATLVATLVASDAAADRILAVDDALARLDRLDPDQAAIVRLRFFGGLGFAEIAPLVGESESTVRRRWAAARALLQVWLAD